MNQTHKEHNIHSEDELNDEINDKLSELWTGMRNKKKQLLRNLTPSYSRRSQRTNSELNATHTHTNLTNPHSVTQNQLLKMKQKLASQQSHKKMKQTQIQRLKNTIAQLTNDKRILVKQIQNMTNQSISVGHLEGQQQLQQQQQKHNDDTQVDGRTANFYAKDHKKNKKGPQMFEVNKRQKSFTKTSNNNHHGSANKQNMSQANNHHRTSITKGDQTVFDSSSYNNNHNNNNNENYCLQDLSKARLIQLLRSTSEYRQFAFYYDSHELSYLKRLQQQHRKNCHTNYSFVERKFWVPNELYNRMKHENTNKKWGLTELQLQQVISEMKCYFEMNEEMKVKETKQFYLGKISKMKRQKENKIPYDLVRLSNAREREICKKRTKSIKS